MPATTKSRWAELARRYRALGGNARLIVVPGKGHQVDPEFFECQELVDFVVAQASCADWSIGPFMKQPKPVLEPNSQAVFRCPVSEVTVEVTPELAPVLAAPARPPGG